MSGDEKKCWLGTLKELLEEHPARDEQRAALLTNLGYLLKSMGDLDKALKNQQKSLHICKEIGEKYGEGTALNNISQIYHDRGDYDTALKYLEQSLRVQQEIGDVAGLCITLFNMGHVHVQNEEFQEAVTAWITVYQLAKKMNLAQVLDALENLAPQIGLEGGLDGWEALATRMEAEQTSD